MKNQVKKIVIKSGITSISENAFNYLPNLKEVVIENGVHTIGKEAFAFCSNLETVTLPDSVINIGDDIPAVMYTTPPFMPPLTQLPLHMHVRTTLVMPATFLRHL